MNISKKNNNNNNNNNNNKFVTCRTAYMRKRSKKIPSNNATISLKITCECSMDPAKSVHQICRYTLGIAKNRSSNVLMHCGQNWSHHKNVKGGPVMQTKSKIVDETSDFLIVDLLNYLEFYTTFKVIYTKYSKHSNETNTFMGLGRAGRFGQS